MPVGDIAPGTPEEPDFFQQVMGNEADAAARRAARKPWWLPYTDVRQCVKMAGAYLAVAVAAFVTSFFVSPASTRTFAGLWLLMSAYCLGCGLLLRRRAERAHDRAGRIC